MKKLLSICLVTAITFMMISSAAFSVGAEDGTQVVKQTNEITSTTKYYTYKFSVNIAGQYDVNVTGALQYYGISFYSDKNSFVNISDYHGSFSKQIYLTKGTYYIKISSYKNYTGKFTLECMFNPVYETFEEEENGSNNTVDTASKLEYFTVYTGLIAENDDKDIFTFTTDTQCLLSIKLTTILKQSEIILFNNKNQVIFESNLASNIFERTFRLIPGTYYIEMKKLNDATGVFTLDTSYRKIGDLNNDNNIDVSDATRIQKYAANLLIPTDTQKIVADVNCDGKVNIFDVTVLQKQISHKH